MENRVGTLFACIGTDKLNSKVMTRQELIKKYGMDEDYFIVTVDGRTINGLFTCLRIPQSDIPDGMHRYDLREPDDDDCDYVPVTVEKFVMVNHYGTFVTDEEIDLGKDGYIELRTDD